MTGTVAALYRYPIKSFQGLPHDTLTIGRRGVEGDRRYALVDDVTDRIASAKLDKALLDATVTEADDGRLTFTLPGGRVLEPDTADVDAVLSAWLGRPVTLTAADERDGDLGYDDRSRSYVMTFDPEHDDADPVDIPSPSGTFLDLAAVHVLTTGSLARCREANPTTTWDVRRFRPNVVVDLDDGGFPEDAWVGHHVRIGDAVLDVQLRTVRCAMPLRAQPGGIERDPNVFRTMRDIHDNPLGVYAAVVEPGVVRVGDAVELVTD
jgi:uncharacterized protein YcbX